MARNYLFGLLALAIPQVVLANSFSLPLTKKTASGLCLPPRGHGVTAQVSVINDEDFWFANFTVGAADDLVLLIDTGSTDVYLNPGVYVPSNISTNLHENFTITFATTNPDGTGTETIAGPVYEDIVALDHTHLSVAQQPLGALPVSSPPGFPHDGLVGFGGPGSALNASSWFQDLCSQGSLDACRFGLALETDNTGVQYFGKVEYDRLAEPLSVAPVYVDSEGVAQEWLVWSDIAVDGKVIEQDALIVTDSGTTVIFGPVVSVQAMFDAAGIQSVITGNLTTGRSLTGYYPCDNPPQFGWGFPSINNATSARANTSSPVSHSSTIFNVLPSQLAQNSTGNNCTASIHGTDEFGIGVDTIWIVGQAFFQRKYIDHNLDDYTMGFANLKGY